MNDEARRIITRFGLVPLPREGGHFARTWTSRDNSAPGRPAGTAILFLLTGEDFSAFHHLDADELWHFHSGDPIEHIQLPPAGPPPVITILGPEVTGPHSPTTTVAAGTWQAARLATKQITHTPPRGWALASCTMIPGWTEPGFELAGRTTLTAHFPSASALIAQLTRE